MPSRLLTLAVAVAQLAVLAVADPEEVCSTVYDTVSYEEVETITLPVPVTTITVTQHPSLTETDLSTITETETAYASASVISLSTAYEHVTSTVHETITNVKTHVSPVTATVTVTTVSTSTSSDNAFFKPINSSPVGFSYSLPPAKRKIKKRANACHPRSTTPQSQSSPTPSPQLYPKSVVCTPADGVYSTLTSTEIAAVVTVTVTPSASIKIVTSTITSTTTVVDEVVDTSYFSITDTATASSDITSFSTTTTTSTVYSSTSVFYAFCGPINQANFYSTNAINSYTPSVAAGKTWKQATGVASAYDCCMLCYNEKAGSTAVCIGSAYNPATQECNYVRGDTACPLQSNGVAGNAVTNSGSGQLWTLSNGFCGHFNIPV